MSKVAAAALVAVLAPAAAAQNDRITWTDGTMTKNVKVQDFTLREIKFSERGRNDERSADTVADVQVEKVHDIYKRAYGATSDDEKFGTFVRIAQGLVGKDDFMAQWGYLEAARVARKLGEHAQAFSALEEMVQKMPDCGFAPEVFRFKLDFYLSQGKEKARSAQAVASQYNKTAVEKGWPDGFVHEASYYEIMARAVDGSLDPSQLQGELKGLLGKTEGAYPGVADRIKVQLADVQRQQGNLEEAKKTYNDLVDKNGVDANTRMRALLGLGHLYFASGDPTNTEPYRDALLAFLRVYLEAPAAEYELKAEALYHGSLSAEKWRGPDSGAMAARLKGYLRRDFPESVWANR